MELSNIKNPIIGFFGVIDDYVLDLELIERIADQFPYCTLLLIGEATCDISQITKKSNVLFLGFRSVEEVANLGAFFDVAILPRKNDEWSKYTNPIKIKEYLALGIKVVTMDIPEVRRYVPEVFIAHSPDEFIDQIRTALSAPFEDEDRILMSKLVENDTWDQRCEEVVIDMKELLTCAE